MEFTTIRHSPTLTAVQRSITGRHVEATKTVDSEDEVALDVKVTAILLRWKSECPSSEAKWLFSNVDTGRPFHADSLRDDHLRAVGETISIPNLGWYAFRHTYRTLIDDVGTPVGVQQKLMRHSDVRTTMNVTVLPMRKVNAGPTGLLPANCWLGRISQRENQ